MRISDTQYKDTQCALWINNTRIHNAHFKGLSFKPASWNSSKTTFQLVRCSLNVLPKMIMSSRQTRKFVHCGPASMVPMRCWKVAGALHNPKGMTLNSKSPSGVQEAVLVSEFLLVEWGEDEADVPMPLRRPYNSGLNTTALIGKHPLISLHDFVAKNL